MADSEYHPVDPKALRAAVVNMAIESWRFGKLFDRQLTKLDAGEQGRYQGQFRWFQKKLDESLRAAQLKVSNVEGHTYDSGIAATPLNIDEFGPQDALVVDQCRNRSLFR